MFRLAWPWMGLAALLPVLVAGLVRPADRRPGAALRIPFYDSVIGSSASRRPRLADASGRTALLAWLLLVFAACRPQWLHDPLEMPVTGRDLLLAVDLSGSMKTADLSLGGRPSSRLDVVKEVAGDFIARRVGDRVGLILFGSRAYLQTPLTFDRVTVRELLDEAEIGLAGEQTAIGDAIGLALKRLRERPAQSRVLILLTDGANTAGEVAPREAAELAAAEGLRIHAIGVGTGGAGLLSGGDLDESTLRAVADRTGGRYFRARGARELEGIYALLDELEPVARDEELLRPVRELFHLPLGLALALAGALLLAVVGREPLERARARLRPGGKGDRRPDTPERARVRRRRAGGPDG